MHESFLRFKCFGVKIFPNHITSKGILSQNSLSTATVLLTKSVFIVINFGSTNQFMTQPLSLTIFFSDYLQVLYEYSVMLTHGLTDNIDVDVSLC